MVAVHPGAVPGCTLAAQPAPRPSGGAVALLGVSPP